MIASNVTADVPSPPPVAQRMSTAPAPKMAGSAGIASSACPLSLLRLRAALPRGRSAANAISANAATQPVSRAVEP